MTAALHVTNGDAAVADVAAAAGVAQAEVLVWREILHDGPVPAGLDVAALAGVRAAHLAARFGASEAALREDFRARDARLAAHPADALVVLWFEDDLFDDLLLAQIGDRLAGRPGPVERVRMPHDRRGGLAAAPRHAITPDRAVWTALRSPDPRAWEGVPALSRLCEELPDVRTGLSRLESEILEALAEGPLDPFSLFMAVAAREDPPWVGDTSVWAAAGDIGELVVAVDGRYALASRGRAVLCGEAEHEPAPRRLGGVEIGSGRPGFRWDSDARRVVSRR